jgi:DNA processing protein
MGRPVFVVPGDVDRPASVGCNRLIRDGAHPVLGVSDLIAELELILGRPPAAQVAREGDLPAEGVAIDDLPELWSCDPTEALARLTHLEIEGLARISEGMAYPSS